jgi:cellulose synthase/poly-beta-1,6-N-acetylglucosamine synthase-like glycosyltransferase
MILLQALSLFLAVVIAAGLAYLYLLLIAGRSRAVDAAPTAPEPALRYALAIPAHNEAGVIGATVRRLRQMAYPPTLFDIHVVADHCTDDTAAVAAAAGAVVHVRDAGPAARATPWIG